MNKAVLKAAAIALTIGMASAAHAQTKIKAGIESSPGSLIYDVMVFFKKDLEARLPGEVEVEIVPGGQLGKDVDVMNGLKLGTHQMTIACSPVQSVEPTLGIFEAPFLITTRDEAKKIVFGPIGDKIMANLTAKGIVGLSLTELGFRQITNNVRPIKTPEDLKGLRIRIPNTPFRKTIFEALGANPTPIAFGETYAALRQGVVDGEENPLPSIYGAKFNEVQKYITIANYLFTPCTMMASPTYFDAWPKKVQDAVKASAKAAAEYSFTRGAELDEKYVVEMKKTSEVGEIDAASFTPVMRPLWDEIGKKVGPDLMQEVITTVSK
ncbi:TRAP transporter substrate-binding protein [Ancylobacter sp. MQZ15Z-1]|uniref:TRAP transporter substrate-binding protein n=1 Tax=Ancylobacter mangrovi TaxID=2972472 RepID=A0A9X2PJ62_9HYPH|nr:TRAP transporter substrate-binding protein [Ancylobacter mangrovi]MCS0497223.1 TRAP transporter substrate-binding protein [Ancylobacter mangrovi]